MSECPSYVALRERKLEIDRQHQAWLAGKALADQGARILVDRIRRALVGSPVHRSGVWYGRTLWSCRAAHFSDDCVGLSSDATSSCENLYWLFVRTQRGWVAVDCVQWDNRRDDSRAYASWRHVLRDCTLQL